MNKKVLWVLAGMLLVAVLSACAANPSQVQIHQLSVMGTGKVYIVPDVAYINIGVHSEALAVTDALAENSHQAQAIASTLKELGIEDKDIQTTAFNVSPQQEFGPNGEVINIKYVVDNTVFITVRDLSSLGSMLDAVVKVGANTINGIQFDVLDKTSAFTEARRLAVEDAQKQAEELAGLAGVKLGDVVSLSTYSSGPVAVWDVKAYGSRGGADGAAPIAAGQISISIDASIVYEIQ